MVYGFGIDPEMKLVCDLKSKLIINELNEPIKIETKESTVKVFINTQERKFIYRNKRCPNEYLTINKEYSLCNNREEEISKQISDDDYDVFLTTIEYGERVYLDMVSLEFSASQSVSLITIVGSSRSYVTTNYQDEGQCRKVK
tara:strand:- start:139 stop:567 length:429 start_codon:yes stop_codon:yes gene_type:complete